MNIEIKLLKKTDLEKLVLKLREQGRHILAPIAKEDQVEFSEIFDLKDMTEDYITTVQSAKVALFPKVDSLFDMKIDNGNVQLTDRDLKEIPEVVLLGTRPCDAAGLESLGSIFTWDCTDPVFAARRSKTTIISISCSKCDAKCFCTSVNGSPGGTSGSDILLTRMSDNNFIAEIITDKGRAILNAFPELFKTQASVDKNSLLADVPVKFDIKTLVPAIQSAFNNNVWMEQSLRCIGCGTCAYVCPTCACFDIQDKIKWLMGKRKRSWDSCGFSMFTLHASGHNPRETQGSRWRQRVMHKFAYMPERQKVLGCVGCGRCGRSCSVDMNLKEHLINLAQAINK